MTRIFYETIAQVLFVAVFGEAIFRICAAFFRATQKRTQQKRIDHMNQPGNWPEEGELDYGNKDVAI